MAAWFGTALVVSIVWFRKNIGDKELILDVITKVEMPASFFIPMTGVLMMIEQPLWLQVGWLHLKILIGLAAVVFSHFSRAKLIHADMKDEYVRQKFSLFRNLCLLMLLIVIIIVGYK
ncbi:MAG: hypothetical protein HN687_04925 [Candidatus Marinimicrobia bacterium]|jgi:uncharacterized membrane protein|nr:hypothetical protein [Candidatus Neomarinimicrobiota bacterium]MBT3948194.1 hypothetical protein [Candidatus Neomarinimicrobiota bacterium]MBT7973472.1 hypothetical protein [Candidatus Neomarinimicrobiota bacterium]